MAIFETEYGLGQTLVDNSHLWSSLNFNSKHGLWSFASYQSNLMPTRLTLYTRFQLFIEEQQHQGIFTSARRL
ncbi:hypothetical protein CVS40_12156 [Lucilia cuprina]|nr:hypothetical protein CVS40_12156 [Lucilia cuprina]